MQAIATDNVRTQPNIGDPTQLRLNEIMARNNGTLIDPADGKDDEDWVEVYNPTGEAIDLQGLYFTDRRGQLTKHEITQSLIISPNGYMIFWLDEEMEQGPTHLSFKLNGSGEAIGLVESDGLTEIDFHIFEEQQTNQVIGRLPNGSGDWQTLPLATPGSENIFIPIISQVSVLPAIPAPFQSTRISAIITDNLGISEVSLVYSRTDVSNIQPSEATTIPMTLSDANGNEIGDENEYEVRLPGQADNTLVSFFIVVTDAEGNRRAYPDQAPLDTRKYLVGYEPPPIVINEIMSNNDGLVQDPDEPDTASPSNKYPDWFELYNYGPETIDLRGFFLSDNPDNPDKNEITSTLLLLPGGTLIFYADEDRKQGPQHVNFRLNSTGENVGIYGPYGAVPIDVVQFGAIEVNRVYGRYPDGDGSLTEKLCLSPGMPNILCDVESYLPFIANPSIIRATGTLKEGNP
ncbi:MAG: lamin tail domain-containing protein [Chloroflexota bacterium]